MLIQRKRRQRSVEPQRQMYTQQLQQQDTSTSNTEILQQTTTNIRCCGGGLYNDNNYHTTPYMILLRYDNNSSSSRKSSLTSSTNHLRTILSRICSPGILGLLLMHVYLFLLIVPTINAYTIPSHSTRHVRRQQLFRHVQSLPCFVPTRTSLRQSSTHPHSSETKLRSSAATTTSAILSDNTTTTTQKTTIDKNTNNAINDNSNSSLDRSTKNQQSFFVVSPTPDIIVQQPYDQVQNKDGSYSVRYVSDDGLQIYQEDARTTTTTAASVVTLQPPSVESVVSTIATVLADTETATGSTSIGQQQQQEHSIATPVVAFLPSTPQSPNRITETSAFTSIIPRTGFNVVLTHCTADFDSLASAVGLAKLWSSNNGVVNNHDDMTSDNLRSNNGTQNKSFDSASHVPTYVVLPRGAHPGVQRFLGLHKHLFPIRSLKSILSSDHISSLNRLALVDAQRRDRLGPAEPLLQHANRITIVDHHVDQDSDIMAHDYVMDQVGSVSTIIVERLQQAMITSSGKMQLSEAEATLLALGIHADTGNLCFDSTTVRDAYALAWCISQGASQTAIAEHGQSSLSAEQQGVLTQALVNANSTVVHGVTVATVLLQADGFINGLAAVTQDAMELSSSDIFILGLVYQAKSGSGSRKSRKSTLLTTQLLSKDNSIPTASAAVTYDEAAMVLYAEAWQGGEETLRRRRLRVAFDRTDVDESGYLDESEIAASLASSGAMALPDNATSELFKEIDTDENGKIDFEEFVAFASEAEKRQRERNSRLGRKGTTMIIIGRVKAGVNMKSVKLNKLLEQFGGGGHAKAASATVRLNDESEAEGILQSLVDELIATNLQEQSTVGDFMTSPVLSVGAHMTEKQVEDMFTRYDVRAFPVVDDNNDVVGLVSYQLTVAAQQRLRNKEQKRLRQEMDLQEKGKSLSLIDEKLISERNKGSAVKGWMIQNVQIVEESKTLAEVEAIFLENDIGCIPVVADGTKRLVGMVTRTDLLRQHRYYPSLSYHNKGFADSIAARKPIIELRKKLKQFDLD